MEGFLKKFLPRYTVEKKMHQFEKCHISPGIYAKDMNFNISQKKKAIYLLVNFNFN